MIIWGPSEPTLPDTDSPALATSRTLDPPTQEIDCMAFCYYFRSEDEVRRAVEAVPELRLEDIQQASPSCCWYCCCRITAPAPAAPAADST